MKFIFYMLVASLTVALVPSDYTLIETGRREHVKSVLTGRLHSYIQKHAERHATSQAQVQYQSHRGWEQRVIDLRRQFPEISEWAEVANESWPGQDMHAAAQEMYRSWRQSPGHWRAVNGKCIYYGYAMRRGTNGVWYACGIFGVK